LEHTSADGSKLNLDALSRIAPSCFTEVKEEKTESVKHVVNNKNAATTAWRWCRGRRRRDVSVYL